MLLAESDKPAKEITEQRNFLFFDAKIG